MLLSKNAPLTAAAEAYAKVRDDILRGVLEPLKRLRLNDISDRYGCGAIPMREALNRLTAENLVVHSEQRGFAVAPMSAQGLRDLARARSLLVEVAMREAVLNGDAAWEERVLVSYHRLSKLTRADPGYEPAHREFHSALVSGCGSQWIVTLCDRLFDHAERYRNLSRRLQATSRDDEHKRIADAALARRVEESVALSKRHVEITAEIILQHPEENIG
jgi:GntR family carbon starvation induced transcriptional regulator